MRRAGILDYFPQGKTVKQYLQANGRLVLNTVYAIHPEPMLAWMREEECAAAVTEFQCSLFDDLTICLTDIFARIR